MEKQLLLASYQVTFVCAKKKSLIQLLNNLCNRVHNVSIN